MPAAGLLAEMSFVSPSLLVAAAFVATVAVVLLVLRRPRPRPASAAVLGLVLATLAAGDLQLSCDREPSVAVLVDVSPSTRTAAFRQPAEVREAVDRLVGEAAEIEWYVFAQGASQLDPVSLDLAERPADRTTLPTPGADALLIFSDGQIEVPNVPAVPAFVVADPRLDAPGDSAVLDITRDVGPAVAVIRESEQERLEPVNSRETVRVASADAWPENNEVTVPPPASGGERWWVGPRPPSGFISRSPLQLPGQVAGYGPASVVVLDDVSAASLTARQQQALAAWVRDAGGGLVLLGGRNSFGAGGWAGTTLDRLSPLSSFPPRPRARFVVLLDASGSMARPAGIGSRFDAAVAAMAATVRDLPPEARLDIGSFDESVRWWTRGSTAGQATTRPPAGVAPGGPTNLTPALRDILDSVSSAAPTQVLVISDGATPLANPRGLAIRLVAAGVTVNALQVGISTGDEPLRQLVDATGGTWLVEPDPGRWERATRELFAAAVGEPFVEEPTVITAPPLAAAPARVEGRNGVWTRSDVQVLGATARDEPVAAAWNIGLGRVVALAFSPPGDWAIAAAELAAGAATDPELAVSWSTRDAVRVELRTFRDGPFALQVGEAVTPFVPVAPGRLEATLPLPAEARVAVVTEAGQPVARRSVAGRYPAEFSFIGNDREAMDRLATASGGAVIPWDQVRPLDLPRPRREISLRLGLALASAVAFAAAAVTWRSR